MSGWLSITIYVYRKKYLPQWRCEWRLVDCAGESTFLAPSTSKRPNTLLKRFRSPPLVRRCQSTFTAFEKHGHDQDGIRPSHQFPLEDDGGEAEFRTTSPRLDDRRPNDGRRRARRSRDYQKVSPNLILSMRLHNRDSPLTWDRWKNFRSIASSKSLRLPVVAAQMLMKQEEARVETSLSEDLKDNDWDRRMEILTSKGITEAQISRWAWILSGETPDSRLKRFLSTGEHKPVFLLLVILKPQETFKEQESFTSLLQYVSKYYCTPPPKERRRGPGRAVIMETDPQLNMNPARFVMLLKHLVQHSLRLWPHLLVPIARLVTNYILTIETTVRDTMGSRKRIATPHVGYAARCRVFNQALQLLSEPAQLHPLVNTKYNWEAQKHLLSFSTTLERQLVLSELSYAAIRKTMIGQEKSPGEEKVAVRSRKTWPPYREEWDGLDERRRPEDDLSRSVKAGIFAREAGYPETDYDRALGALGGAVLGQSPTVQTRSAQPKLWTGKLASLNVFTAWAAEVKATRNAHEAWKIFDAPRGGLKPNFQVYAEMFEKLLAHPVSDPSSAVPGNAKEVFPPYESNLTAVEKARLQPPSVAELYDRMLHSGDRPVGRCLVLLVANAHTEAMAMQYLLDSPFRSYVPALCESSPDAVSSEALEGIPLAVFNAYILLLCKLHADEYLKPDSWGLVNPDAHIQRAIALVSARLRPDTQEGRTYKPPWHNLMRALATTRTLFVSRDFANNHLETLSTLMRLFEQAKEQTGMDVVLLELLCFGAGRTMTAIFTNRRYPSFELRPNGLYRVSPAAEKWGTNSIDDFPDHARNILQDAHQTIVTAFNDFVSPDRREPEGTESIPQAPLRAAHIYRYMRTLGLYDDTDEMVNVMKWILRGCERDAQFLQEAREAGTKDHAFVTRMLAYFRGFAEGRVAKDDMGDLEEGVQQLADERGIPWMWPEAAEGRDEVTQAEEVAQLWSSIWGDHGWQPSARPRDRF